MAEQGAPPPELLSAWLVLGDADLALEKSSAVLAQRSESWRAHVVYVEAAQATHARWYLEQEYRWLAENCPPEQRDLMRLLRAWTDAALASGEDVEPALEALGQAAQVLPDPGILLHASALLSAGEAQRALQALGQDERPEAIRLRVRALVRQGKERQASKLVQDALQEHPERPDMAVGLWGRGADKRALARARRKAGAAAADLLDSHDPLALYRAWQVLARGDSERQAAQAAEALTALVPDLALPPRLPYGGAMMRHLGEVLARSGKRLDSLALTEREARTVALEQARALMKQARREEAAKAYREALKRDENDVALLIEVAEAALDGDPQRCLALLRRARRALAQQPGGDEASSLMLSSLLLEARALEALDRWEDALAAQLLAARLGSGAQTLLHLAALQERLGHGAAALASYAEAAALGSEEALAGVEGRYRGPAAPQAVLDAAQAGLQGRSAILAPEPLAPKGPEAVLAQWTLSTTAGPLSLMEEGGAVVVLAFWASWCRPCQAELPRLAELSRAWRAEGLGVEVVAVSVDEREGDYRHGRKRYQELGMVFAWAPDLGQALPLQGVPTTLVLGPDRIEAWHEGYSSEIMASLDREVRRLAGLDPAQEKER